MADIGKVLKDEIARISKREANSLLAAHINTIRTLKRDVSELRKQIGKPVIVPPTEPAVALSEEPDGKRVWFTSKGIAGLRKRLGVTRAQMASLCGVSLSAVVLWETAKTGKLNLRTKTREALTKLRQMTPASVKKALAGA